MKKIGAFFDFDETLLEVESSRPVEKNGH